jgi:hypothetical protein
LDEYKSLKEIPIPVGQPAKPVTNREKIKIYQEQGTGRVVDDPRLQIDWKPIDQVAARVVSEQPWWAHPPQPEPKFVSKQEVNREPIDVPRAKVKKMLTERGYVEEMIDLESVAGPALENHEHTWKKDMKANDELTGRAKDLIAAIDYLTAEMRGPWAQKPGCC